MSDVTVVIKSKGAAAVKGDVKAIGDEAEKSGSKFSAMGKVAGAAVLGLGAAGIAAGAGLFKLGQSFDSAFDTIAVGTGATGDALKSLQGDFKKVFTSVPTDMGKAATAIADLNTRTGLTGKSLQDMSKQMLEMTRITGGDLSANIRSVTRVMGDWGVEGPASMDKLFVASQATGIGIDQLANQMVQFGAPLRQLGFDFDTSAALLGKFEKEGVNAELVMGSLRIALGKMARDGEPAVETLERTVDAIKNAGSTSEANAMALELFGARAGPDMAAAIREGRFAVDDLVAMMGDAEGAVMRSADSTASFGQKWTLLKNQVLTALEPMATKVLDFATKGMGALAAAFPKVERAVTPVVTKIGDLVSVAGRFAWGQLKAFGEFAWDRVSGPLGTIAGFIGDVGSAAAGFAWDALKDFASFAWDTVVPALQDAATAVADISTTAADFAWDALKDFAEWADEKFGPTMDSIASKAASFASDIGSPNDEVKAGWESFLSAMSRGWDSVKSAVQPAIDAITPFTDRILPALKDAVAPLGGAFKDLGGALKELAAAFAPLKPLLDLIKPHLEFLAKVIGVTVVVAIIALVVQLEIAIKIFSTGLVLAIKATTAAIELATPVIKGINTAFATVVTFVTDKVFPLFVSIVTKIGEVAIKIGEKASEFASKGKALIQGLWDGMIGVVKSIIDWLSRLGGSMKDAIGDTARVLWDAGRNLVTGFFGGIVSAFDAGIGAVTEKLDPRNWDIPGLSPLPDAMTHAGQIAGRNIVGGFIGTASKELDAKMPALEAQFKEKIATLYTDTMPVATLGGGLAGALSTPVTMGTTSTTNSEPTYGVDLQNIVRAVGRGLIQLWELPGDLAAQVRDQFRVVGLPEFATSTSRAPFTPGQSFGSAYDNRGGLPAGYTWGGPNGMTVVPDGGAGAGAAGGVTVNVYASGYVQDVGGLVDQIDREMRRRAW